ncbi:MAG: thioredoxin [Anaerolineae bacterium]|nr:MAG: thioredoxin [Anaerolineae bacterium]
MSTPVHVTDDSFDQEVLQSELPTVVDFWAESCAPCKHIAPILEDIAAEYDGQLKVTKLEVDENPDTAGAYGVMSIPTLLVFKEGQPVERIVGYMPKERLMDKIKPHM